MKSYTGTEKNYERLAAAIVEVAVVDYVDALIVRRKGYLNEAEFIKACYKAYFRYGKNRYLRKGKFGIVRQDERKNMMNIAKLTKALEKGSKRRKAVAEIEEIERFFRSPSFALYMPNTDPEEFIKLLRQKAERGERVRTQYR